jgi:hypothetical protein
MTEGQFLWTAVLVLAAVANLVVLGRKIFGKEERTMGPQPFEVKQAEQFVSREHCEQVHQATSHRIASLEVRADRMEAHLQQLRSELIEHGDKRAGRLHQRLDEMSAMVERAAERSETTLADLRLLRQDVVALFKQGTRRAT